MGTIWRVLADAAALAVATWAVPGIHLTTDTTSRRVLTLLGVAAAFALLNAVVKPLLHIVGSCLIVLTLGLFLWVINAVMLMLASSAAHALRLPWHVDSWGAAFWGALIVSVVSWSVDRLVRGTLGVARRA